MSGNQVEKYSQELATELGALSEKDKVNGATDFIERQLTAHSKDGGDSSQVRQVLLDIVEVSTNDNQKLDQPTAASVLEALVNSVNKDASHLPAAVRREVIQYLLSKIQHRSSGYENVVVNARQTLAKALEEEGEYEEAGNLLRNIQIGEDLVNADTILATFRTAIWATNLFTKAGGCNTQASTCLNKAAMLLNKIKDPKEVFQYRVCQANVLSHSNKFIEASAIYRNLSQSPDVSDTSEQKAFMEKAIQCAILAAAGPQKMQALGALYETQGAKVLPSFSLVEKMFLKRLIKRQDFEHLAHQELSSSGSQLSSKLLEQAICEYNIFVLPTFYTNISLESMGALLGVNADEVEQLCAKMIAEGRMQGRIDQVTGIVEFEGAREAKEVSAAIMMKRQAKALPPPMYLRETVAAKWDNRIAHLCQTVEKSVDLLIDHQPAYAQALFRRAE